MLSSMKIEDINESFYHDVAELVQNAQNNQNDVINSKWISSYINNYCYVYMHGSHIFVLLSYL
jgi:DNA replication initiation complex subunit (GINS family)